MEALTPTMMVAEVEALAGDMRDRTQSFARRVASLLTSSESRSVQRVYLLGSGDSYHASWAAQMAFESIAHLPCQAVSALAFRDYHAAMLPGSAPGRVLTVATSASGKTPRVIEAIGRARERGALTVGVTCRTETPLSQVVDRTLILDLPDRRPSPAIRSYQACLLGLLLLAIRLGEARAEDARQAELMREELTSLGDVVEATNAAIAAPCRQLAASIAEAPVLSIVGSGPNFGTARFSAAKIIEAAGLPALGQDLEEWWHVERFAYPVDMPLFVIAPPSRAYWRAVQLAEAARSLGRRIVAVTQADDQEVVRQAHTVLPVRGAVREEFSPLLYHLFASRVASHLAQRLGRLPFQTDRNVTGS